MADLVTAQAGQVQAGQGAVLVLRSVRFLIPAEPGVHVSMHRALRVSCPVVIRLLTFEQWLRGQFDGRE